MKPDEQQNLHEQTNKITWAHMWNYMSNSVNLDEISSSDMWLRMSWHVNSHDKTCKLHKKLRGDFKKTL